MPSRRTPGLQYLNRQELEEEGHPCPSYSPTLLASIAGKARGLVAAAVARGWVAVTKVRCVGPCTETYACVSRRPTCLSRQTAYFAAITLACLNILPPPVATLQMLLPAVTADGLSGSDAVVAMDACCPKGASLLHVAVGTGSVPLIHCLSSWGATQGRPWLVDAPAGSDGVTPLHVAALLTNSAAMREALAGMAPSVNKLWGLVQAQDGTTPESLCEALAAAAAAAPEASAASTASTSSDAGTSSAAAEQQPSGSKPHAELEALPEGEGSALVPQQGCS